MIRLRLISNAGRKKNWGKYEKGRDQIKKNSINASIVIIEDVTWWNVNT